MKNRISLLLILLGLALFLFQATGSFALESVAANRSIHAGKVVDDQQGLLALSGFNNTIWPISNNLTYKPTGSITNNTSKPLHLTINAKMIAPLPLKKFTLNIRFGSLSTDPTLYFSEADTSAKSIQSILIQPGQTFTIPVQSLFKTVSEQATVSYSFRIVSTDGKIDTTLQDSAAAPRRQIFR